MGTILLQDNVSQNREDWVEKRKGKLGGSEIAIAAGLHPTVSPFDLWLRMTDQVEPMQDNDILWFGRAMEPVIAELITRRTGNKLKRLDATYYNEKWPDFIASPDYEYEDSEGNKGLDEFKTAHMSARGSWGEAEAPDSAHCQLQWQLGIMEDYKQGHCAGLIGGSVRDFYYPLFEFDPEVFAKLREVGEGFLHLVKTVTPPETRPEDLQKVQRWLGVKGEPRELDASFERHFALCTLIGEDLAKKEAEVKRTKAELDKIKMELLAAVGDAPAGICGDRLIKRSFVAQNGYTVKPGPGYYKITIK